MDPIEALKLQTAMKNHKAKNHHHLLYAFIPYLLTALTCSLFCSYLFWLPSIEHFLFITLPNVRTSLLSPKCLFLVVNAIVAFLLGESKLGGLCSSAMSRDEIYEEYVERSRTRKMLSAGPGSKSSRELEEERMTVDEVRKEEESEKESGDGNDDKPEAEQEEQEDDDGDEGDDDDEEKDERDGQEEDGTPAEELKKRVEEFIDDDDDDDEEKYERDGQEEDGIPAEELKKRVEEFIARVNRQRWLEARSL
ncbi:hypothetical protein ACJRO7_012719 [Eucalyptus globulus]|uniref:DUF4408 domain-containing protein n=1 Tax=Eucalyptus globulus TaxID=34317 RepID=A0ABD3LJG0_EUCGL